MILNYHYMNINNRDDTVRLRSYRYQSVIVLYKHPTREFDFK